MWHMSSGVAVRGLLTAGGTRARECRLSSLGARALSPRGMWNLPKPGIEPVSAALAGGFLSTVPPGKSQKMFSKTCYVQSAWGGGGHWGARCPWLFLPPREGYRHVRGSFGSEGRLPLHPDGVGREKRKTGQAGIRVSPLLPPLQELILCAYLLNTSWHTLWTSSLP